MPHNATIEQDIELSVTQRNNKRQSYAFEKVFIVCINAHNYLSLQRKL